MVGLMLGGALSTITEDEVLHSQTRNFPGYEGSIVLYSYYWFNNDIMFLAMSLVGFLWLYEKKQNQRKGIEAEV